MNYIGQNDELLQLNWQSYRILDSLVTRIDIYVKDFELCVDIHLTENNKDSKKFVLNFSGIIEYGFYHNEKFNFYNVGNCKFFKAEKGYYLSLDPFDESENISEDDQDFIYSKNIKGYLVS